MLGCSVDPQEPMGAAREEMLTGPGPVVPLMSRQDGYTRFVDAAVALECERGRET